MNEARSQWVSIIILYRAWCDRAIIELCRGDYVHSINVASWNTTMPQRKLISLGAG